MTQFLKDIERQPRDLVRCVQHHAGPGRDTLMDAAARVANASCVIITGMGSSWYAGWAVLSFFQRRGMRAHLVESSELVHFASIPEGAAIIFLSRSGASIETIHLLEHARQAKADIVAVTNTPDSPLGAAADVILDMVAGFDNNVSASMYSALTLVGGLLAEAVTTEISIDERALHLVESLTATGERLPAWQQKITGHDWFSADAHVYFLARGGSLACCYEAELLWEEAAKTPATAMPTGTFRHGPQEIVGTGINGGMWLDRDCLRDEDLALANDMRSQGMRIMLIGQDIPDNAGDLIFNLPSIDASWQFLTGIIPAQLAAEHLSQLRGADCDNFRHCSYVVDSEGGMS